MSIDDSQIMKDLQNHRRDKLREWVTDTMSIYDSAGASEANMLASTVSEMVFTTVQVIRTFSHMDSEQFAEMMRQTFIRMERFEKKKKERDAT
jgi:hypothetical protein